MRIGINGGLKKESYEVLVKAGMDYLELPFSWIAGLSDEQFAQDVQVLQPDGPQPERSNGLLSADIMLVGDNATADKDLIAYLHKGFKRLERFHIPYIVWGSGNGRKVPDGFDRAKAEDQLLHAGLVIGNVAAEYGTTIVVEPLNRYETNTINTVEQGAAFVQKLNHPHVRLLADSYHMCVEGETFDHVVKYKDLIKHAHIAEGIWGTNQRRWMPNEKDEGGARKFIEALRAAGYDDHLTIEAAAPTGDWSADVIRAVATLRSWLG